MSNVQKNILIVILFLIIGLPCSFLIVEMIFDFFGFYSFSSETIFFTRSSCDPQEAEPTLFTSVLVWLFPFVVTYFLVKIISKLFFKIQRNLLNH